MLSSCIVTSVGEKYKNLIGDTLNNIPLFINKIIIINDTGETLSLNNGEERIIILDNKESIGLSKSLEKWSKEYYRYDLLFRIDIGDLSKQERFINQYKFMHDNPNYVLCGYETKLIFQDKKQKKSFYSLNSFLIKLILYFRNCIVHGSICIRTSALKEAGGYLGYLKSCQDIDLYLRLMKKGKFAILKGPHHEHKFQKHISTTFSRQKENYKVTSIIRFFAARKNILAFPFLLISSGYYFIKYLLES